MDPLFWAGVLLVLGLLIAVLEVFVPSGGILGVLCISCLIAAVVLAFRYSVSTGVSFLGATVVALPLVLLLALHYWPHTRIGRRILLDTPTSESVMPDDATRRELRELLGQTGHAKSLMLPSGAVMIRGRLVDAVSEGMTIEPGQMVKVVEVRGTLVVVRPIKDQDIHGTLDPDDPLSRPFDSIGLNPFEDDPLT